MPTTFDACNRGSAPLQQVVADGRAALRAHLDLGGTAGGDVSGLSFPTRYFVDYVRIYPLE